MKMKPISLKIKGLNSFIEEQTIDFKRLTDKGLFGIFGPTGSGKSTILDGITLALYGEVSRKSSNFINTNCNSVNVVYHFQISGAKIKKYTVEREFKRDKSGNIRSKSAKILDVTCETVEVLEEGAKNVTAKCKEIIGLELDDFTRTVVLPQGKFSDFLKLEGKDRRNMLERLFNLQKYGDNLSNKLIGKIKGERQKYNILQGELKGYEDIDNESLKLKEERLELALKNKENIEKELIVIEKEYNENSVIWNLQEELRKSEHIFKELKLKEKENNIKEIKILKGESYLKIKPYMDARDETLRQYNVENKKLNIIQKDTENIKVEKEKLEAILKKAIEKKENELPSLKIKKERIDEAMEEAKNIKNLKNEAKYLDKELQEKEKLIKNINNNIKELEEDIIILNNQREAKEKGIDKLKVSNKHRTKINEGVIISNDYKSLTSQKKNLLLEIDILEESMKVNKDSRYELKCKINELNIKLNDLKEKKAVLVEKNITDPKELLKFQEEISYYKDKWNRYDLLIKELEENNILLKDSVRELNFKTEERNNVENVVNTLRDYVNKVEIENLAQCLREKLFKGYPCPVCGSIEHSIDNLESINLIKNDTSKENLKENEEILKEFNERIIILKNNIDSYKKLIEQQHFKIEELGEDFKKVSIKELEDKFELLRIQFNKYDEEKNTIENNIKKLSEDINKKDIEYSKIDTIVTQNTGRLEKLKIQLDKLEKQINDVKINLIKLKEELKIENFEERSKEISENDNEITKLEINLKELREDISKKLLDKENLIKKLSTLNENLKEKRVILQEKNKRIVEKENYIINIIGNIKDLALEKEEISNLILEIESNYIKVEREKKSIDDKYNKLNEEFVGVKANVASLIERGKNDRKNLDKALIEEKFSCIEEANEYKISRENLDIIKREFKDYNNKLSKIIGAIENLKNKIGNNRLTEEQWQEIKILKEEKNKELKMIEEVVITLKSETNNMKEKLMHLKELLNDKKQLEYKMSLLDDLDKLFKGKKFVEFVAYHQLKYVSLEASKRLKEITNGNYGLEVDDNGKFIIRDYKNGGSQRDASTLSGGETFLVSLSLALALSAQIQLKGIAPLELFFFDEGFGTLDDELLDIVMCSLEKIHNEKLSVGIISHVESIKNRVPVKLILTPAQSGLGGSKVKIERS